MIDIDKSLKKLLGRSSPYSLSVKRKYYPQKLSPMDRRPSGLASPFLKNAPIKMQNQWKNMSIPQRSINKILMPDFDRDGVPNKWDCQPMNPMMQDFTPFPSYKSDKAAEMTAARRFGGRNLKRLKKLGQGRDRVVYALDKDKVLKVAKNPGGLTQNTSESDLDYLGQLKHYETGKDYAVMQRAEKPGEATRKFLKPLKKAASNAGPGFIQMGMRANPNVVFSNFMNSPEVQKADEQTEGLFTDLSSYGPIIPGELIAKRQWGEVDGKPVLIDAGALQDEQSISKYRVKDFQKVASMDRDRTPWQLEEWRDVQNQRQQFRTKGKPEEDREIYWAKRNRLPENYVMREAGDFFNVVDSKEELNKQKPIIVYHGTKPENVPKILKEGIRPSTETGTETWERTPHKGKVYLTPSKYLAKEYGGFDANLNTSIIKVKLTEDEIQKGHTLSDPMIRKDEIVLDRVPPERIVGVIDKTNVAVAKEAIRENRKRSQKPYEQTEGFEYQHIVQPYTDMFNVVDSKEELREVSSKRAPGWSKGLKSDLPAFEGGWGKDYDEYAYEKRRVLMTPEQFLKRQYPQRPIKNESTYEEWKESQFPERVEKLSKALDKPEEDVPIPIEEYDVKGRMKDFQEGRHRGLAAAKRGEMIPVLQVRKKLPPWDRENRDDPFTPKKDAYYLDQEEVKDNQWDKEKGLFDYDSLADYKIEADLVDSDEEIEAITPDIGEETIEDLSETIEETVTPETYEEPEEYQEVEDDKLRQEE